MNGRGAAPRGGGPPSGGDPWAWIERLQRFGIRPGLERVRALLAALGDPQAALEIALVAGTNGKGSTTALLDAMLRSDPARRRPIGRFVSPHLERFDERIWIDGGPPPAGEVEAVLEAVRPAAERLGATFFEVLVAVAALAFARAGVGRAVLEVGLGGRWDATNATEPSLSVVTQIDLDHEAILGRDVATIAAEKAGILRPGVPAVTSATGTALAVVRTRAAALGAPLRVVDEVGGELRDLGWAGVEVVGFGPGPVASPLLGAHQARNLATAVLAAAALGVPWPAVVRGAADVRWPGRLELLQVRGRRWLLDGAHNPAGARALAAALRRLDAAPALLLLGATEERVDGDLLGALADVAPRLVATRALRSPRSAAPEALAARLRALGVEPGRVAVAAAPEAALSLIERGTEAGATIVVAGSLFLVAEVRALLRGGEVEAFERWQ